MSDTLRRSKKFARPAFAVVPEALIYDTRLPHGAVRLYAALARHVNNETGYAFPGQERLAALLGVSERTVRTWLDALTDAGWVEKQRGGGASRDANTYWIREWLPGTGPDGTGNTDVSDRKPASGRGVEQRSTDRKHTSGSDRKHTSGERELCEREGTTSLSSLGLDPAQAHVLDVFVNGCRHAGHPVPDDLARWGRDIDLLIRRGPLGEPGTNSDARPVDPAEAERVIRWTLTDRVKGGRWQGWAAVIRSPRKFREKYDQLAQQAKASDRWPRLRADLDTGDGWEGTTTDPNDTSGWDDVVGL